MNQTITGQYPSNIALVKYWGKYGQQLPCNASLSLTLSKAFTEVKLQLSEKKTIGIELDYFFEGQPNAPFKKRIIKYVSQQPEFSELFKSFAVSLDSHNSFPHSAGIASSASAFAAIAAVLLQATHQVSESAFHQKASCLARLGSGSACRSFFGPFALWGSLEGVADSSNEYAIPVLEVHENFKAMKEDRKSVV